MRQAAIALLAVPIVLAVYAGALLRRSAIVRSGLAFGLALAVGVGIFGAGRPATTIATAPAPIVPLAQAEFTTTFSTNRGLTEPVTIRFSTPMDSVSVAAEVAVDPPTPITLAWDPSGTILTVAPKEHWAVGTFHTITVRAGALARSGQPLARPIRASFLTRGATTATAQASAPAGDRVALTTSFIVSFARPVAAETVAAAIRLDPQTVGTTETTVTADGVTHAVFTPIQPLMPDVRYRLLVSGVRDADGMTLDPLFLAVQTVNAPTIVRFRPRAGTTDVVRDAPISVRFTQAMDRRSTARAFSVTVGTRAVAGTVAWAEHDTVLVFTPKSALPFSATVSMDVAAGARAAGGSPLASAVHSTFRTVAAPSAAKTATVASNPSSTTSSGSSTGGGAVGGGSWAAVETYYLGLMNCTRTGGWVTSTGSCSSPGGRNVAPLQLDSGISSKVSRPYAKRLAVSGVCSHFIGGNPGTRLRAAGYTSYRWAENLGCRSGSPKAAVLGSHLFFQSEKSYGGGHYVNLMNAAYDRVGIGVWVSGGRVRLVVDFYHS